jgi:hypothetical protein
MSSVAISGNASGAGVLTIAAPNTASSYTLTLPQATDTLAGIAATQTLTNKTLTSPTITGAVVSTMASSVLTSGTAVASTSGTSIGFTNIPSWAKRITVMLNGVSTSSTNNIQVQLGTGATPTYVITGYLSGGSTSGGTLSTATTGFFAVNSVAAAETYSGSVVLFNITGTDWVSSNSVCNIVNGNTRIGGGSIALGATLTAVRLIGSATGAPSDSFDAGSINILYE